ncbi:hypothetical protein CYLTODRAFT_421542 [Cylindrobasidium torrendii FP15055 ss-10]|uniref:Mug135-like C-terminal domain-containing protein n=1 Tax=Cylindrobasidium torrendii FP15055 ss-10 TaxID=1314674 RepID=A0A0D7BFV3_9AGAR|nr:hypothetical protein CYLTODRAFT_421542 [Cylindrobasidium torrendii FP15055 ss-10]
MSAAVSSKHTMENGLSKGAPAALNGLALKEKSSEFLDASQVSSPIKSEMFDYLLDNDVTIYRDTVTARDRANRTSNSFLNRDRGDGRTIPYVVMPFLDGSRPDQAPHSLPPLLNVDTIEDLTDDEVDAYVEGYGLSRAHGRDAIKAYIGCTC